MAVPIYHEAATPGSTMPGAGILNTRPDVGFGATIFTPAHFGTLRMPTRLPGFAQGQAPSIMHSPPPATGGVSSGIPLPSISGIRDAVGNNVPTIRRPVVPVGLRSRAASALPPGIRTRAAAWAENVARWQSKNAARNTATRT